MFTIFEILRCSFALFTFEKERGAAEKKIRKIKIGNEYAQSIT